MIGNDIIDLNAAALESNPLRPGFQKKIFSIGERVILQNSIDPVMQTWILWSMKESAYKAHQRKFNLPRNFNPLQLRCLIDFQDQNLVLGEVEINFEKYYAQCNLKMDYLHCCAIDNKKQKALNEILPFSAHLKKQLLIKLSSLYNLTFDSPSIIKNKNSIPFISNGNETLKLPFSLSHHGKFKAFSLPLMNY